MTDGAALALFGMNRLVARIETIMAPTPSVWTFSGPHAPTAKCRKLCEVTPWAPVIDWQVSWLVVSLSSCRAFPPPFLETVAEWA